MKSKNLLYMCNTVTKRSTRTTGELDTLQNCLGLSYMQHLEEQSSHSENY